jgi:hypothetical protein
MSLCISGRTAILALLLPSSSLLAGDIWTCEAGGLTRKIVVESSDNARVPCKIVYKKPSEKKPDVILGGAERDPKFCASKAETIALKLQNRDWSCSLD